MKPRLSRPLLAAVVSGAIVAGGAVYTSPVLASGPTALAAVTADDPAPSPSDPAPSLTDPASSPTALPDESSVSPTPDESSVSPTPDESSVSPTPDESSASPTPDGTTPAPAPSSSSPAPVTSSPTPPRTTPPKTTSPAPAPDRTKPKGTFRLNLTSIWIGQKVTFGQNTSEYSDDRDADRYITRKINWGDGTSTTLSSTATSYTKQYTRSGRFNVTVTLTDRSRNAYTTPAKTVSVTVPGKYSLSKYTVYQGAPFDVRISSVPAGTTRIAVDWGDGWTSGHAGRNQTISGFILYRKNTTTKISGKVKMRIAFANKNGSTSWIPLATVNLLKDTSRPVLTVTKPSKSNSVKSWKTVKGTVKDKGAGVPYVYATVIRATTSGKTYCLTPSKKWKRYTTDEQFWNYCSKQGVKIKPAKGKWSLKLPSGLTKGQILVYAWTWDWADNYGEKIREARLTKN